MHIKSLAQGLECNDSSIMLIAVIITILDADT